MPVFLKQQVNQWLCIALIALMAFWIVLYYMTNKAQAVGDQFTNYEGLLENEL